MKKHLRILSAIVMIVMTITVFASCMGTGTGSVKATDANGTYEGLTWTFEADDLTLTITGSGDMKSFANVDSVAWKEVRETAKIVVIAEGITSVGDYAFSFFTILEEVKLPSTVKSIGRSAFEGCTALKSAEIPASVKTVGERAFFACKAISAITFKGEIEADGIGADFVKTCPSLAKIYAPEGSIAAIKGKVNSDKVTVETPAPIVPPVEEESGAAEDNSETESTNDTEADKGDNGDKKLDLGGIIAIVVMAIIIIAGVVGVIIYVRKEKKAPKNTTTVVKKDKGDKKDKKSNKK